MAGCHRLRSRLQANDGERGAILFISAALLSAILLTAALVIDLGAARVDRASNQVVTDSAVTAGVTGLLEGGGRAGCDAALGYVEAHIGAVAGLACGAMPIGCDALTPQAAESGTVDGLTVTITHPVDDDDPLMDPGSVGAELQAVVALDGDRCDRIGVQIDEEKSSFFSQVAGIGDGVISSHSVARPSDASGRNLVINLLLLEREECEVLSIGGGGSSGGISVSSVIDPATGDIHPGRIAVDSNGTIDCASRGTIHVNGSGASIIADGEPGCPGELAPVGLGSGCGRLDLYAPGTPGCNLPGCSNGGTIAPDPVRSPRRITRTPIDWRYNCKATYPAAYDIRRCPDIGISPPYIDQLILAVNTYGSYHSYRGAGFPCQINGGPSNVVTVPEGNWIVDCNDLRVQRTLIFEGGNVVFEGDVSVGAGGHLSLNGSNTSTMWWTEGASVDPHQHSAGAAYAFFVGGTLNKSGGATLEMHNTMVYLSDTSELVLGGGSGVLEWTAPTEGPFRDLALWSDSPLDHNFAGSATLLLEGIFFTPLATVVYTGNGGQDTVEAQFIARKLSAQGNGSLQIAPKFDRSITFPPPALTELIR